MKLELFKKNKKLISFVKMHGDGNDFVIVDNRKGDYDDKLTNEDYVRIANRRIGIGCDQVVTLNKSKIADCTMIIHNTDGSKAEMCGNAARCVAYLIINEKSTKEPNAAIETITGTIVRGSRSKELNDNAITINMGKPKIDWREIPLSRPCDTVNLPIQEGPLSGPVAVNMGNPHIVFFVNNLTSVVPFEKLASNIEKRDLFENGVNVSVAEIEKDELAIKARIWERGVGITQSCGSASCAIFVASIRKGYFSEDQKIKVKFPGGDLLLRTDGSGDIFVTGKVCYVFNGTMYK